MNGSKTSSPSSSKPVDRTVGYIGMMQPVKGGTGESNYQTKSQINFHDKQTGSYKRATNMEKASSGEFQWKNGTSGTRNEYKQSQTIRIGDRKGYTEVYSEQRVRKVIYNNRYGGCGCRNDPETYSNYGGYGYSYGNDSDSDSDYDSD